MRFSGKKVLVTGGGRGIGKEIVKSLAAQGATVFALGSNDEILQELKKEIPSCTTIAHDLTDVAGISKAVNRHLPFDMLVNNAGMGECQSFLTVTPEVFDKTMTVNLKAVVFLSQIVAKSMIDFKIAGSIVMVSSQASLVPLEGHTAYSCSKAALDMLAKTMTLELGQYGIRTNCVNPTVVMTDMGKFYWGKPEKGGPMLKKIPLGKFAEIEDVVSAVLFLLSDDSKMISGVKLPIDGGFCACASGL